MVRKAQKGAHEKRENDSTAVLFHVIELGHSINWGNYEILIIETDYHLRKFIESFYINLFSMFLTIKYQFVFQLYTKIPQFSWSSTKR